MTAWVLGFDLSLTAPAAVAIPLDWRPGDWKRVRTWLGRPPSPKQDDLRGQLERYEFIADWALNCAELTAGLGDLFGYVEAYGFSRNNASASRIMESGGIVKAVLWRKRRLVLQPVTSSEARKLTLGFNPRRPAHDPKVVVQDTVLNKFGAPKTWDENLCDAFVIAQWGMADHGGKFLALPPSPPKPKKWRERALTLEAALRRLEQP